MAVTAGIDNSMKLDFDQPSTRLTISGYSVDGINLGGRLLDEPFVVSENDILVDLLPRSVAAIEIVHIEKLVALRQSIILIGTGATQIFLDGHILLPALEAHIGVEIMSTPAACRSFNVLVAENRAVTGAFYMP